MIPATLAANPSLERWVSFPAAGKVRVAFGKVEYGQGAMTALAQIAAEELDVHFERLIVVNAATGAVPDEGMTVGSMSIEMSGASVRAATAGGGFASRFDSRAKRDCAKHEFNKN